MMDDKPKGLASIQDAYNKAVLGPIKLSPEVESQLRALTEPSMKIEKSKLPEFIEFLKGNSTARPVVANRIDFIEDLLAALAMSSFEDSKLFKTLLGVMNTELAALKTGTNLTATQIEKMKEDVEECQRLVNERPNLTIENNIFNNNNAQENPAQNSQESKRWYSKIWGILNSPFCLGAQTLINTIVLIWVVYFVCGQQATLDYFKKQLPIPVPPASAVGQTLQGSPDSFPHDNYSGSRTRSHSPEDASPKRGDKSQAHPASE